MEELIGTYNFWFVGLSIVIAAFASYTALDLGGRVSHSTGWRKKAWLLGGSITMGIGIWSMHFVGMIAFQLPMPMSYDPLLVFLSMLAAFLGSFISLFLVSHRTLTLRRLIGGGIFMGIAIVSMHYIGMVAMEMVTINYDPFYLTLSVLVAILASMTALKLSYELSNRVSSVQLFTLKLASAILMGAAISGMHYIGMTAATFYSMPHAAASHPGTINSTLLAIGIAIFTLLMQSFLIFGTVTDRRLAIQATKLREMAYFDHLTGLSNRRRFIEYLDKYMREERRFAVFFLDLNRFKIINDALGHNAGDLLLKGVSERLRSCIRKGDLVARLGGDEFTIIMSDIQSLNEPTTLAKRVIKALEKPFLINNNELHTTVSIGIAMVPEDGDSSDVIMKHADMAMYASKQRSKSKYYYYSSTIGEKSENRLCEEQQLREGIEQNEFFLEYQPQIDASSNQLIGVESLVRWLRPNGKIKPPNSFIPLAEETALIIPLGKKILDMACRQAKDWSDKGFPTRVSVNLSARQFQSEDIVQVVSSLLEQYQLRPELLELEVTESMTMENIERSILILNEFRRLGVYLSIDDFGTAHSSLRYLKDFPIQQLKIDRSFIREINLDPKTERITSAIIAMGQHLNLETIAEGVETEEQLSFLLNQNCTNIQGFFFSKPISVENIEKRYFQRQTTDIVTPMLQLEALCCAFSCN
ncbi:putative bifunctional diguanylate cyclase/phosphodiesterase [Halobacillus amylolyticus]|uniref:EAL domain-containing protein n=1 Tax=Halobacillus amylolyticus TaxID=2932259 RepID=A0ABY4HDA7_9BACI|nr:bifunctional diguanylate cyclase/phosphodiesterase [Halobacillus amylolyticus]UOR11390.1 EAL domain-containing protein [Halobacillus amylolyticus]